MTIYEHAMVGVCGALAAGLQRRHGWQIVAWAGAAAVLPDWDGLSLLLGPQCFAAGHRLWGHNLLLAGVIAAIVAWVAYQTDVVTRLQALLARRFDAFRAGGGSVERPQGAGELALWIVVGVLASYSHLLADIVFNGSATLPPWGVPLFWPFGDAAWAYPLVSWGDIGASVIFAAGMLAMLRWPARLRLIAAASLLAVALYLVARGILPNVRGLVS
jgi:membrane-bound metal-dependent hydrolase YbcI (DUF457 family)